MGKNSSKMELSKMVDRWETDFAVFRKLPEEGQNLFLDWLIVTVKKEGCILPYVFTFGDLAIGARAKVYLYGKIPFSERLAAYRQAEKAVEKNTEAKQYLSIYKEMLIGDAPRLKTKEKNSWQGSAASARLSRVTGKTS